MREGGFSGDMADVLNHKLMAGRAELALMRIRRLNYVQNQDRVALSRLTQLLQAAAAGDKVVSGEQMAETSEQSLELLRQTLKALVDLSPGINTLKERLHEIVSAAESLSGGNVPAPRALGLLVEFVHRYSLIQADALMERDTTASEVAIWPTLARLGYSSMS